MNDFETKINQAQEKLKDWVSEVPKMMIVLGSGLADLIKSMEVEVEIPFTELPHVKPLSVEGHVGTWVIGKLSGTRVLCMKGRLHYYEGHSMEDVVFPFRLLARSGCELFFLTNASGGMNSGMKPGDLVLIRDHINQMGSNPLIGPNIESLGPRFPDMSFTYDPALREVVKQTALEQSIELTEGVYVGTHGPSYETPAEIESFRRLGADIVGMSTVPEAIALSHMGKKVVAISCVTNLAAGMSGEKLVHTEVLENANKGRAKFERLVAESLKKLEACL